MISSPLLDDVVIIPRSNSKKLLNIEPLVLTREDVTNNRAWYMLAKKNKDNYERKRAASALEERDFKNHDKFIMYYLHSLGLLEFPVVAVGGEPESGKSLFEAWLTYQKHRLFGKTACLDWAPPEPKYFGSYRNFMDDDFQHRIVDEFDILHRLEQVTGQAIPLEVRKKIIVFNTEWGLEEADGYAHKQMQTNTTKVIAMVFRRRRHLFMGITIVMIDPQEFADVVLSQVTHTVTCYYEGHFPETCSMLIEDVRKGGTGLAKWLWLKPKKYLPLWDSHNIPAMTHRSTVSFGKRTKQELLEFEIKYRSFIETNMMYFSEEAKDRLLNELKGGNTCHISSVR